VKKFVPDQQLVLAGGGATDDPEGEIVLREVREAAEEDPDIHILLLPPDAHRKINALQRAADIILQKSIREGFGLTVTEAMWKGKPVIGGDTGGIGLQVINFTIPASGSARLREPLSVSAIFSVIRKRLSRSAARPENLSGIIFF
jgi:glycosyltransferase involved in cell wall biosynthesis